MFNKNRVLFTCELMIGFYFIDLITFFFLAPFPLRGFGICFHPGSQTLALKCVR